MITEHRRAYLREYRKTEKFKEYNRKKSARYRADNPEKSRARDRARYLRRKSQVLQNNATRRARLAKVEGSHTLKEWERLVEQCHSMCIYCYLEKGIETPVEVARDHVMPISLGGPDYIGNIWPACKSCNSRKGGKSPREWFDIVAKNMLDRLIGDKYRL